MNTATVSLAVTPTVVSTLLSHYVNRKPQRQKPTAHLSYNEGLHLIRSFLSFASRHTVEDLQAFTAQWVPHPQWVKVEEVEVPDEKLGEAANALLEQLGPDGIRRIGGRNWWQWRAPKAPLKAEWIEMRSDYHERKKSGDPGRRVMLYVHGGAYFFGSVDEHRYQMQRHARKLKARVFAPRYRLSPQFPFPCGLQDCIAAYLYLLSVQDPTTIILAGDSAGAGMVLSLMVTLRDQGIPLPAGAILLSPWVDLTHSFPSVSSACPLDYIPQCGFHHKPSQAWPPLNADELGLLKEQIDRQVKLDRTKLMKPASVEMRRLSKDLSKLGGTEESGDGAAATDVAKDTPHPEGASGPKPLSIVIDGQQVVLKDQIQMYATNELLTHPLVSPVLQPTLGGLPPLLIMTGGGEVLRDEQIYLAHKCANPAKYAPGDEFMDDSAREQLKRYKPTDVQLQVWDDLCHVAPTLSFTRPAKFMYRSASQFGAWALAHAQHTAIEIPDDDDISIISSSSDSDSRESQAPEQPVSSTGDKSEVGKAGDPLPPFTNHMIRQRVNRHGVISPLEPAEDLPSCTLDANTIGVIKEGPVRKWLETRRQWENRFGSARAKIHKRRLKEMAAGYVGFDGESPPPTALAGHRKAVEDHQQKRRARRSMGLALWSLWGSKHDEEVVNREQEGEQPEVEAATADEGRGARSPSELRRQEKKVADRPEASSRSRTRTVRDELQTSQDDADENTQPAVLQTKRGEEESQNSAAVEPAQRSFLAPDDVPSGTGVAGKRLIMNGVAVPFSLNHRAGTASMITLTSTADDPSRLASPRPISPETTRSTSTIPAAAAAATDASAVVDEPQDTETPRAGTPTSDENDGTREQGEVLTPVLGEDERNEERPHLEKFLTAQEDLPRVK